MRHEAKKIAQIVSEMLTLFLLNGAENIDIKVNTKVSQNEQNTEIIIIQYECNYEEEFIQKMKYNLSTQRQYEIEGYYWQLVGEDDSGDELHLVGAMVDKANVTKKGNDLHIQLLRKA
jgi:predicted peptidase